MRLRYIEHTTIEDRKALKPAVGDTVIYEGTKYKVTNAGMKYIRMVPLKGNQTEHVAKMTDVTKVFPETGDGTPSLNLNFNP